MNRSVMIKSAEPADLIITDLFMPDYDGIETILELRRTDPTAKIVAMSGGGLGGTLDLSADARSLGALRTFQKPPNWHELLEAVREILGPGGTG
jgi:DNA-binding NtrC family response regulator